MTFRIPVSLSILPDIPQLDTSIKKFAKRGIKKQHNISTSDPYDAYFLVCLTFMRKYCFPHKDLKIIKKYGRRLASTLWLLWLDKWISLDNSVIVGGCIDQISGQTLGFPADRLLSLKPSLSSNHSLCSQCTISNALGMSDHNSKTCNFDICECKWYWSPVW